MIEERLQEIGDILSNKHSSYYVFHSKKSDFNTKFPTPIKLNPHRNYEMALHYFSTSNHLVNISEENNQNFSPLYIVFCIMLSAYKTFYMIYI